MSRRWVSHPTAWQGIHGLAPWEESMSARWTEAEVAAYRERQQSAREPQAAVSHTEEPEARFLARVVALAKAQGALVYHTFNSKKSEKGFPDLCIVLPPTDRRPQGVCLFAELKAEHAKLTKEQQLWMNFLRTVPGIKCFIWRPSQFEEIRALLS